MPRRFLWIRVPALSSGVGLVDSIEGTSCLPVLVLLLSRLERWKSTGDRKKLCG